SWSSCPRCASIAASACPSARSAPSSTTSRKTRSGRRSTPSCRRSSRTTPRSRSGRATILPGGRATSSSTPEGAPTPYDVVILGGAVAGAAAALLLRRDLPRLSVLVVERALAFDAKVGEATTEMSGMFLTRRLAQWQHLEREHLPKEGLRYWFGND